MYNFILTIFCSLHVDFITDSSNCLIKCPTEICKATLKMTRGNDYYVSTSGIKGNNHLNGTPYTTGHCLISMWSVLHFVTYFIGALLIPDLWWAFFIVGVIWELYEFTIDAHDMLGIIWNSLGIISGVLIRKYVK